MHPQAKCSPQGLAEPLVVTQLTFCGRPSFSSGCPPVCERKYPVQQSETNICQHSAQVSQEHIPITQDYMHECTPVSNAQGSLNHSTHLRTCNNPSFNWLRKSSYWSGSMVSILTLSFWYTVRQLGQRAGKLCLAASSLMRCQHHKHMLYPQVQN